MDDEGTVKNLLEDKQRGGSKKGRHRYTWIDDVKLEAKAKRKVL
jgi:hypothetical protein